MTNWYEVWVDESPEIPYVLFVYPSQTEPGKILIIDPKENNKVIKKWLIIKQLNYGFQKMNIF